MGERGQEKAQKEREQAVALVAEKRRKEAANAVLREEAARAQEERFREMQAAADRGEIEGFSSSESEEEAQQVCDAA